MKLININDIYKKLCSQIIQYGEQVGNTKELINVVVQHFNIDDNIVSCRTNLTYLLGELIWYFAGSNDLTFINKFSKFWNEISDDGKTSNSAYGDIIFNRYGFNQFDKIVELLQKDKYSRRAVINFNVPNKNVIETKDEICTIALQFFVRDERLHCTAIMRSNDIYTGFPYDITFFTTLQKLIADKLKCKYGSYTHIVTSMHLYDKNFDKVLKLVKENKLYNKYKIDHQRLYEDAKFLYDMIMDNVLKKEELVQACINRKILLEVEKYDD